MKKLLFLLPFCCFLSLAVSNAQTCHGGAAAAGKSCCASKAAAAASADATIEKRMADDGTISYVRKESDAQGNAQFVSVRFDEASNAFVNVAPPATASSDDKAGMVKKSCSASGEKKACCAAGAKGGKACCAGKAEAKTEQ